MADPLSIVASSIAIISFGLSTCNGLMNYYDAWKAFDEQIANAFAKIESLASTLKTLQELLNKLSYDPNPAAKDVGRSIIACYGGMQKLQKKLEKFRTNPLPKDIKMKFRKIGLRTWYPFQKDTLKELLNTVKDLYTGLSGALHVLEIDILGHQLQSLNALDARSEGVEAGIKDIQLKLGKDLNIADDQHLKSIKYNVQKQNEQILDWISTIPYNAHHRDISNSLLSGSGAWLFVRPEFQQWITVENSSLLWLRGDAGTGKTNLMSLVVNQLMNSLTTSDTTGLAYFYCSRISGYIERQETTEIVRSLIRQLSGSSLDPSLKSTIVTKYEAEKIRGSTAASFTLSEAGGLLTNLIQNHYSRVCIIVDGLDECDSKNTKLRKDFFAFLLELAQSTRTTVKVMVSSRNEPDTFHVFGGSANHYIHAEDNASDISRCIDNALHNRLLSGRAPPALKRKVKKFLEEKAQGMFRWVALQLDWLCDNEQIFNPKDVETRLESLPETLEATYTEIISRIGNYAGMTKMMMANTLRLLMCAEATLEIPEVLAAVSLSCYGSQVEEETLVHMAQSLIIVDRSANILRFSHLSVREYLEARAEYSDEVSHALVAEACLLSFGCVDDTSTVSKARTEAQGEKHPLDLNLNASDSVLEDPKNLFVSYASCYWGRHCKKAGEHRTKGRLKALLVDFFYGYSSGDNGIKSIFSRWTERNIFQRRYANSWDISLEIGNAISKPSNPLFISCVYDFYEIVEQLMSSGEDILNLQNDEQATCIHIAGRNGSSKVIDIIVKSLAKRPGSSDWREELMCAAAAGTLETMQFVLNELKVTRISPMAFSAAIRLEGSRQDVGMIPYLLQCDVEIVLDPKLICRIIRSCSKRTIQIALGRAGAIDITENHLVAAAQNELSSKDALQAVLQHSKSCSITEEVIVAAAEGYFKDDSYEAVEFLLSQPRDVEITQEVLRAVAKDYRSGARSMSMIISTYGPFPIAEDLMIAGAINEGNGKEVLEILLRQTPTADL